MEFANKEYFLLLLLLIPYVLWYFLGRKKSEPTMRMSDTRAYLNAPKSWREHIMNLPMLLRCITFTLIVIVLARPQTHNSWGSKTVEGIDIMLAMDVSTSMLAEEGCGGRLHIRQARRQHRIDNIRRRGVHTVPHDHGSRLIAQLAAKREDRHSGKGADTRRNRHRNGTRQRHLATERLEGEEQGRDIAYRRL